MSARPGGTSLPDDRPPGRPPPILELIERPLVAEDTDWFEGLTPGAAKEERIIFGVWVARLVTLVTILCVVAYATNA